MNSNEIASVKIKSRTGRFYTHVDIHTPTHAQTHEQECVFCKIGPWK